MEARLGVFTCAKCGEPLRRNQPVVVIGEGWIRGPKRKSLVTFWGSCVRYACHLDCWDGTEEN
jgi:hypothetical protein